jgi:hypothetical protein
LCSVIRLPFREAVFIVWMYLAKSGQRLFENARSQCYARAPVSPDEQAAGNM